MLVLSRKKEESVVVGGSSALGRVLRVTVLEIGIGKVKLGFEANEDVAIHRSEVWQRICPDATKNARQLWDESAVNRAVRLVDSVSVPLVSQAPAARPATIRKELAAAAEKRVLMRFKPSTRRMGEYK